MRELELRTALSESLSESPIDKVLLLIILTSGGLLASHFDFAGSPISASPFNLA
jgi:hypothetical protein